MEQKNSARFFSLLTFQPLLKAALLTKAKLNAASAARRLPDYLGFNARWMAPSILWETLQGHASPLKAPSVEPKTDPRIISKFNDIES